jgi:hypothetical protein
VKNAEYVGRRYGKWLVTDAVRAEIGGRERNAVMCECDCGQRRIIMPDALKRGMSTQCSTCSNRQKAAMKSRLVHGKSNSPLHRSWIQMRARCSRASCPDYPRYGGRGISVCAEWANFPTFQQWAMENGFRPGLTIDRRDNDGNYEPGNCRWITRQAQNRNRGDNKRYPFRGQMLMVSEIAEITGQPLTMLRQRIQTYGWSVERATTQPPKPTWKTIERKAA